MSTSLPTVAIIGQTNVGKSSLFNRLMRSHQAIVAREAGTTRDNVVGKVTYGSHSFWAVDTAGVKTPEDEFEATIQEQITEASELADVILVVVDATLKVSPDDRMLAKKALKSKKPVLLVINKTDLKGAQNEQAFAALGIKTTVATSAEHSRGITALLDTLTDLIPPAKSREPDNVLRVALIGRPNVGKSSLFNSLAGKQQALVASRAGTTRDVNRASMRYGGRSIELLDTAGVRRNGKVEVGIEKFSVLRTLAAIEQADVCLLLMPADGHSTQLDQKLAGIIKESGKGLVIVVSKWDAYEKDAYSRDAIAPVITANFDFVPWAPLIFTSALTGQNVTKLFDIGLQIDARRVAQRKTRELNDLLQACLAKHPPAGLKNTHPKLRYMVQTDTNPPWFVIFGSSLKYLHWSYKRYLERAMRESFDYTGTAIKFSFRDENKPKKVRVRRQES